MPCGKRLKTQKILLFLVKTSNIVRKFEDPRLKFIQHKENLGADVARHTGLQESTGEIVSFWDHDDLFHPENIIGADCIVEGVA